MSTGTNNGYIQIFGLKGVLIQQIRTSTNTFQRLSSLIPQDDTIPQNTEGTQIMSVSITPTNAANILVIQANVWGGGTQGQTICCALFQDSNPNALACMATSPGSQFLKVVTPLTYYMAAGTTSPTTFKIRVGPDANAFDLMGGGSNTRIYGGAGICTLTVAEYES